MKSDKMPYIAHAYMESLIKKAYWAYSMRIINVNNLGFDHIEIKHTLYCGKDCMKRFCESLREHAHNIFDFEKKKMLLLTKEIKSHQDAKACYIYGKRILQKITKKKLLKS